MPSLLLREAFMFMHNKRLMYTVRVAEPNPMLSSLLLEQFGGPQGELAAAMRYFSQALAESDPGRKDMLLDIATEELSHLEVIGSIIVMMNKGVKGKLAEGTGEGEPAVRDRPACVRSNVGSHGNPGGPGCHGRVSSLARIAGCP